MIKNLDLFFLNSVNSVDSGRTRRHRVPFSLLLAVFIVLGLQLFILPRYVYQVSPSAVKLSQSYLDRLDAGLQKCAEFSTPPTKYPIPAISSRVNPRWNPETGQNETIVLRNATLFDGESVLKGSFDISFSDGIISGVWPAGTPGIMLDVKSWDLKGKFITPGLVDLHSHHLAFAWPLLTATSDTNEVNDLFGALTPFVRVIDSMKAYDIGTTIIASGGVTSSLILPGSANIMGGEAYLVKNMLRSGPHGEEVVEEILLEHGVPKADRRRYMKMACGENPRRVYKHTRMGNAWVFRKHMERARELREKQDSWCVSAAAVKDKNDAAEIASFLESTAQGTHDLDYLEFDSTIAMLRGQIGVNVHCYETEDFEDMIKHSKEFDFRIQAFHHALSAWQVPEMIKDSRENITIATFAEFGFYKKEGYESNLYAGKILAEHGVPVAYKSDHVGYETNAKYLLFQAATAHSFGLSEQFALQSVTSVPARSLEIDHRVGFVKPGYDADLVVWDSHPLSVGATPFQVYIDGRATLNPQTVEKSTKLSGSQAALEVPKQRKSITTELSSFCEQQVPRRERVVITGIVESFLSPPVAGLGMSNRTMIVDSGKVLCFDQSCAEVDTSGATVVHLENGFVLPGLTAVSVGLGLIEIPSEGATTDGSVGSAAPSAQNIVYAKYGVHLEGKNFKRAIIGGITNAISAPTGSGFLSGVSVGIKTKSQKVVSLEGVFQDEVALHFHVGQESKLTDSISTVSSAIAKLRQILSDNETDDNIFGSVANGSLPLVVHAENEYDIAQLVKVKEDYPELKLVIFGGSGAPLVATELAKAEIPVILTANRGAPDSWEKKNLLVGPPLTMSAAAVLSEAGVLFGLAIPGEVDAHIHNLPLEAGWAAKYAGLNEQEAVDLVSRNIEKILDLNVKEETRDFVIWEGNPMEFGANVVLSFDGKDGSVASCWPDST